MLISLKHRLAFLAVPKTGTTAIEAVLRKHAQIVFRGTPQIKHMAAPKFEMLMRPYLESIGVTNVQTLAVMRDPIDHLQSWYFYRRRLDEAKPHKLGRSTRDVTLEQFLEAWLAEDRPDFADLNTQSQFLCGKARLKRAEQGGALKPLVDIIFPYEKMEDVMTFLGDRLGRTIEVERKNTSKREKIEIAPALRARLEDRLADDIALHKRVLAGEFYPDPAVTAKVKARNRKLNKARKAGAGKVASGA